ncbi:MAG: hypothetical protein M0R03_21650 [Novosphingobium sp.]|nr:hypothetical protein [Novosphingobium sp.]
MKLRKIVKNKKGELSSFSIFTWMITAFLVVVFFASLIWVMGLLNDVFTEVGVMNEQNAGSPMYTNMTLASQQIWGQAYQSIQALRMVSIVYILALAIGIVVIGFLERKHPFLFFVYLLITLLAVIFAPTISNAYENLLNTGIFDGGLEAFTTSNFIILNLPVFVLIIGVLGGIGLFINLIRGDNTGEIR